MRERFNDLAGQAGDNARTAYNSAREHPGTIAAVIVGVGVAAFLMYAARRAGGWRNLQTEAMDYARQGVDYAKQGVGYAREGYGKAREVIRERAANFRGEQLPEDFRQ
jgi:hypothetical protein